jgi:hypothetical protein
MLLTIVRTASGSTNAAARQSVHMDGFGAFTRKNSVLALKLEFACAIESIN